MSEGRAGAVRIAMEDLSSMRIRGLAILASSLFVVAGLAQAGSSTALANYTGGSCTSNPPNDFHSTFVPTGGAGGLHPYVGTTPGGSGRTGTADAAAGVCADDTTVPGAGCTAGGDVEVGASETKGQQRIANPTNGTSTYVNGIPGVYAIADGSDTATQCGGGQGQGYLGVSNYESGSGGYAGGGGVTATSGCSNDTNTEATPGSNSGGAFQLKAACGPESTVFTALHLNGNQDFPLPLPIACGNTSGNDWDNTKRDGCYFP